MSAVDCGVAVLGAGPYGLSTAAHLTGAGADVRVVGRPMSFWREQMPAGMLLRSPFVACNISDPDGVLTLGDYEQAEGLEHAEPVPLERFVDYGEGCRRRAALERRPLARHPCPAQPRPVLPAALCAAGRRPDGGQSPRRAAVALAAAAAAAAGPARPALPAACRGRLARRPGSRQRSVHGRPH